MWKLSLDEISEGKDTYVARPRWLNQYISYRCLLHLFLAPFAVALISGARILLFLNMQIAATVCLIASAKRNDMFSSSKTCHFVLRSLYLVATLPPVTQCQPVRFWHTSSLFSSSDAYLGSYPLLVNLWVKRQTGRSVATYRRSRMRSSNPVTGWRLSSLRCLFDWDFRHIQGQTDGQRNKGDPW